MRTPPQAYYQMRSAYANWFYKLPASVALLAVALLLGRARPIRAIFFTAAAALLLDSVKDRAVYETSRSIYQSTPDTLPS